MAGENNLTVVGDEDQSIYESFRFAHPEGISAFEDEHEGTLDIPLNECRRCPTRIVGMANDLIRANLRRLNHPLLPRTGNLPGEVHVVQWQSMQEEADGIATYISKMIHSNRFDAGQTLVLSPRRQFGYLLKESLHKRNIPAHSFFHEEILEGNPKKIEDSQAQQAFTLLNLLINPGDGVALRCWLGFGHDNLRAAEYKRLRDYCAETGISTSEAMRLIEANEINLPRITGMLSRYRLLLQHQLELSRLTIEEILELIFPIEQDWSKPFQIILKRENMVVDLSQALKVLKENIVQPELPTDVDYVRIMSLHKSKGLTADHVIVVGCIEGIIPTHPDENSPFETKQSFIEEQRRLFYVAITRTRKTLVLSNALQLPRELAHKMGVQIHGGNNQVAFTQASSFIGNLGPSSEKPITGKEFLSLVDSRTVTLIDPVPADAHKASAENPGSGVQV